MDTGTILKMRHHRKGRGTKHTGRVISDQHRHHHENKRVKSEERAFKTAAILKKQTHDIPMPFIDIGIEKLDSIIASAITDNDGDLREQVWQQIINLHPATENDVFNIIQDIITTTTINKTNNLKAKLTTEIQAHQTKTTTKDKHEQLRQQYCPQPRHGQTSPIFNNDALTDKWLDSVFWNNSMPQPEHLLPNTKCPRCKTGFIIYEINRTVCINCGFSEDFANTHTLKREYIIKWLIRNRTDNFSPPYSLLLPRSENSITTQMANLQKTFKLNDDTPSDSNVIPINNPIQLEEINNLKGVLV